MTLFLTQIDMNLSKVSQFLTFLIKNASKRLKVLEKTSLTRQKRHYFTDNCVYLLQKIVSDKHWISKIIAIFAHELVIKLIKEVSSLF